MTNLFTPLQIGPVEVPNRLFMTAHGTPLSMPDPEHPGFFLPSPAAAPYYAARAAGGLGLIVQAPVVVHPSSQHQFGPGGGPVQGFMEHVVPHLRTIVDAVHAHDTRIFLQLWHGGHQADRQGRFGGPISSSAFAGPDLVLTRAPREMSHDEIRSVVDGFATAARHAADAGYDGVEISATHGYLIEQFLSPFFNKRTDEYGGSLRNRYRFCEEIVHAIKQAVGDRLAIGVRLIADEQLPGGIGPEDAHEIVGLLDENLDVDFVDLDLGTHHDLALLVTPSGYGELPARDVLDEVGRAARRIPVLGCPGALAKPGDAVAVLERGVMDMVGGTRAFIADPEFARKARAGAAEQIRPCIRVNECWESAAGLCAMNPTQARESLAIEQAPQTAPKGRVLVIGGGPAGMETARTAALRGFEVTLREREHRLGGALHQFAALPDRTEVERAIRWYEGELWRTGIAVELETVTTASDIAAESWDHVVVATGARFDSTGLSPETGREVEGWDSASVTTPEAVLDGRIDARRHDRVVILDDEGHSTGLGLALLFARAGSRVEFITRWPLPGPRLQASTYQSALMAQLDGAPVRFHTDSAVESISDGAVHAVKFRTGRPFTIGDASLVVLTTSRTPIATLADELLDRGARPHVVGDARSPGLVGDAVRAGRALGERLGIRQASMRA